MDTDILLIIGVAVMMLAIPSVISAFSESRPPRAAAVLVLIGGGLIVWAMTQQPGGYDFADIPQALIRVIGRYF